MLSAPQLLAQIALISYAGIPSRVRMRDDVIMDLFIVTENKQEEGKIPKMASCHFKNKNLNYSALSEYFSTPFWLIIDINGPYPQ